MDLPPPQHRRAVGCHRQLPEEHAHPPNPKPGPLGSRSRETPIVPRHIRVPGINWVATTTGRERRASTTREGSLQRNSPRNGKAEQDRAMKLKGKDLKGKTL